MRAWRLWLGAVIVLAAFASAIMPRRPSRPRAIEAVAPAGVHRPTALPSVFLWAWERPEDLSFIDPEAVGVAFLAKTLRLHSAEIEVRPRQHPLQVPPDTVLIAVVRIESAQQDAAAVEVPVRGTLVSEIADLTRLPNIRGIQIDFDARESERGWYRQVLAEVRAQLPASMSLSMTALASWCLFDDWITGLPVDAIVPMLFRMGPEGPQVRAHLEAGRDFRVGLCRSGVGISTDEPLFKLPLNRRVFIFNPHPWSAEAAVQILARIGR